MRLITFFFLLIFGTGCNSTKHAVKESIKLNGTWMPVEQEIGGKPLPKTVFEKERLIIRDSSYTVIAESTDKGLIKCRDDKMDIYGKEGVNAGKHFTAIYKFENGQLTICYNFLGDSYPETFDTKAKPTLFLSVFKKSQ